MSTLKTVEELVKSKTRALLHPGVGLLYVREEDAVELLTQDRHSLHTSLVAAVEGLKYQQPHVDTPFHTEDKIYAMNATLDQVLTIINSIFKE